MFFQGWWITEMLNCFQTLSFTSLFFNRRGGPANLSSCLWPYSFIQYLSMISLENVNSIKISLKILISFKFKVYSQQMFTGSKSTIEAPKTGVEYAQS